MLKLDIHMYVTLAINTEVLNPQHCTVAIIVYRGATQCHVQQITRPRDGAKDQLVTS